MEQEIFFGIDNLIAVLKPYNNILVVHGSAYNVCNIGSAFGDKSIVEFTEFSPNPKYTDVCAGTLLFKENMCDAIVACGGGSAIDVAKCIKLFAPLDNERVYLDQEYVNSDTPLIAIPTTAGTGSESTKSAVIYYEGVKQSVAHECIVPDAVILDSVFLNHLPAYQKKCTLLDALCQAIESRWSKKSNEESSEYSEKAISLIKENWEAYLSGDKEAANAVLLGSNFSGRAINITTTTAPHAMSYKLTSMYGIPHGHSVALCMREVWRYTEEILESDLAGGYCDLSKKYAEITGYITREEFEEILNKMNIFRPVSENAEGDVAVLAESVNPERLNNNPIALKKEIIKKMYRSILSDAG